jgi:hypothetical protein
METCLSKKVGREKVNKVLDFCKWLNEVKRSDDPLHDDREYKCLLKDSRDVSHHVNSAIKPSRCVPNPNNSNPSTSTANSTALCKQCPTLLQSKHQLLKDNDGCLKCRCVFVNHHAANCPNNFPSPVNYWTLTQADVDHTKRGNKKTIAAVATSSASVYSLNADTSTDGPTHTNALQYHHIMAYVASNASNVIDGGDSDSEGASLPGVSEMLFFCYCCCDALCARGSANAHATFLLVRLDERQKPRISCNF